MSLVWCGRSGRCKARPSGRCGRHGAPSLLRGGTQIAVASHQATHDSTCSGTRSGSQSVAGSRRRSSRNLQPHARPVLCGLTISFGTFNSTCFATGYRCSRRSDAPPLSPAPCCLTRAVRCESASERRVRLPFDRTFALPRHYPGNCPVALLC